MPQRTAISQKRVGGGGAGRGEEGGRGGDFRSVFVRVPEHQSLGHTGWH